MNPAMATYRGVDTGAPLRNPGMGWVLHYYDNAIDRYGTRLDPLDALEDFPGLTTVYFRLAWSYLEPSPGAFRWDLIDTPAQQWLDKGYRLALRITCCETAIPYATPQWVQAAGARGVRFERGRIDPNGSCWEPDYDDPVLLAALERFLFALGKRYVGCPEIAFVDIGSFGVWGKNSYTGAAGEPIPSNRYCRISSCTVIGVFHERVFHERILMW